MLQDSDESNSDMDEYVHSMEVWISGREGYMAGNLVLALQCQIVVRPKAD